VTRNPKVGGTPIGVTFGPGEDPEALGVTLDRLNGILDPLAGHGTFIAGLVRQHCANAQLVIVPVMYGDGAADEKDLIDALQGLLIWHWLRADGREEGDPLDVVSLSLGYYHETPGAVEDEAGLFAALRALQREGVAIVAAAGNGATTLPFWPAALAERDLDDCVPLTSVGALNPNDGTVAAFSNTGSWVRTYRCGVSVVSTMPVNFDGSLRGGLYVEAHDGVPARGTPDPDDYSTGFGVWSGSSFASPACAGHVAGLLSTLTATGSESRVKAVTEVVRSVFGGGS
jgi:subtilisin family serine protease